MGCGAGAKPGVSANRRIPRIFPLSILLQGVLWMIPHPKAVSREHHVDHWQDSLFRHGCGNIPGILRLYLAPAPQSRGAAQEGRDKFFEITCYGNQTSNYPRLRDERLLFAALTQD